MIAAWRQVRQCAVALLAVASGLAAEPDGKRAEAEGFYEDFRIFLNVKQQLVEQCIARPSEMDVVTGALAGLQRELDAELTPYFPERLPTSFPKAFDQYQRTIRKLAALPELGGRTVKQLVEQSLRAYSRKLYRFSDYDDRDTVEREKALRKSVYSGVGMTLDRTMEGIDCYPFVGEPASVAGCVAGDRLIAVDGKPVRGLNVVDVGAMIAGTAGSEVQLTVRRRFGGKEETLKVKRGRIMKSSIGVEMTGGAPTVRVGRLTMETVADLKAFLRTVKAGTPLTLDLRGCPGGELEAAVGIAELFLPARSMICKVETRAGSEEFRSKNPTPFLAKPLVILQDKGTASGAELIIVALATHPKVQAETRGERSFGKGFTLVDVEVANGGGRLRFADGRIYGPNGEQWDGEGLTPTTEDLRAR